MLLLLMVGPTAGRAVCRLRFATLQLLLFRYPGVPELLMPCRRWLQAGRVAGIPGHCSLSLRRYQRWQSAAKHEAHAVTVSYPTLLCYIFSETPNL